MKSSLVLIVLVLALLACSFAHTDSTKLTGEPIIFIHGVMGAGIQERTVANPQENQCGRTESSDWTTAWLAIDRMALDRTCLFETLKLQYTGDESDNGLHMYAHHPAYQLRATPGSEGGNIGPIHTVDKLFARLEHIHNGTAWKRDDNLLFFSYNWLSDPLHWSLPGNVFDQLDDMIKDVRARHGGKRVTIISHSNGAVLFTNFMRHKDAEKITEKDDISNNTYSDKSLGFTERVRYADENIARYLAVAPALGGSMNMISIYWGLLGSMESHHLPHMVRTFLPPLAQGIPGVNYLFPRPTSHTAVSNHAFLLKDKATGRKYTYDEITAFLADMAPVITPESARHWKYTEDIMSADKPEALFPGIRDLYFLYSADVPCTAEYTVSHLPRDIDDIANVDVKISKHVGGDGTMVAANVRHYARAFSVAGKSKRFCPTIEYGEGNEKYTRKGCSVSELVARENVSHGALVTDDHKHHMVSDWVLSHVPY